jgi:hypothetical protein
MLVEGARGLNKTSRTFYEGRGRAKALAVAKDAVALAKRVEDNQLLAFAHFMLSRAHVSNGMLEDALKESSEAMPLFKKKGDVRGEASTLLLNANVHLVGKNIEFARMAAADSMLLFKKAGDGYGEALCENLVQRMTVRAMPGAAAGGPVEDAGAQEEEEGPEVVSSVAIKSATVDIMSLPMPERVRYSIAALVSDTTGRDDIEDDRTLMETGMTSISSIMLRDRIQDEFPEIEGMDLTFVFDYPTIREMSEFIIGELPDA